MGGVFQHVLVQDRYKEFMFSDSQLISLWRISARDCSNDFSFSLSKFISCPRHSVRDRGGEYFPSNDDHIVYT